MYYSEFSQGVPHPEIDSNPESMQHAQQVTLRHLLNVINVKTWDVQEENGRAGMDLWVPGSSWGAATVSRTRKGLDQYEPLLVGRISIPDRVAGNTVSTHYTILDCPDGLEISKWSMAHQQLHEQPSPMLPDEYGFRPPDRECLWLSLKTELAEIEASKAVSAEENELGLNFVSEQEARDVLSFLTPLEPYRQYVAPWEPDRSAINNWSSFVRTLVAKS